MHFYFRTLKNYTILEETNLYSFETPSRIIVSAPQKVKHNRHGFSLQRNILGNKALNRISFAKVDIKDTLFKGIYYTCTLLITTKLTPDESACIIHDLTEYTAKFETRNVNFKRDSEATTQDLLLSFGEKERVLKFNPYKRVGYIGYAKRIAHSSLDASPETILIRLFLPVTAFIDLVSFKNDILSLLEDVAEIT